MHLAAGDEGDEGGVDLPRVVVADEQPVLAADGLAPQLAFGAVVVDRDAPVPKEGVQSLALVANVVDGLGQGGVVEHGVDPGVAPVEEGIDDGARLLQALLLALLGREALEVSLELEELADEGDGRPSLLGLRGQRLEEVAAGMSPASSLGDLAVGIEVVVDAVSVGDQDALVPFEHRAHGGAVVLGGVAEQDVTFWRDDDPEVPAPALVLVANQDPGGIGAQVRRHGPSVAPHRVHQRSAQPVESLVPAAHRRLRQHHSLAGVDFLQPVERHVVPEAADDRLGQQPGPGETTLDGEVDRLGDVERGRVQPVAVLGQKLHSVGESGSAPATRADARGVRAPPRRLGQSAPVPLAAPPRE